MALHNTDPEFMARLDHFMLEEVPQEPGQALPEPTRHLAILATLLGCQGLEVFRDQLPQALVAGVTPVMVKELVYQAVDYLGWGRVKPFLTAANEIFTAQGVTLPLPGQATTTLKSSPSACPLPGLSPESQRCGLRGKSRGVSEEAISRHTSPRADSGGMLILGASARPGYTSLLKG